MFHFEEFVTTILKKKQRKHVSKTSIINSGTIKRIVLNDTQLGQRSFIIIPLH